MTNEYIPGEIEYFGQIPAKTELTVVPADPDSPRFNFTVREQLGSPVYLAPDDFDGGDISPEEVDACMTKDKVLKNLEDIQIGTKLFISSLFGAAYGIVDYKSATGDFSAHSPSGKHGFYLTFRPHYLAGKEDPQDLWVCWGQGVGMLSGIKKLELSRDPE